jgi:hypothetical protein
MLKAGNVASANYESCASIDIWSSHSWAKAAEVRSAMEAGNEISPKPRRRGSRESCDYPQPTGRNQEAVFRPFAMLQPLNHFDLN